MFRDAYRKRRCIVPVEGFFEWQATKGGKQPYAIAMKNGAPFGLAGLWENWKDPTSGDWVRTFTIITVPSNELIARIHDRMPAILRPADYERWLGSEPDPHDLLITFPSEPMKMWPISKRVNSPRNDDEDLLAESTSPRRRELNSLGGNEQSASRTAWLRSRHRSDVGTRSGWSQSVCQGRIALSPRAIIEGN